MKLLLSLLTFAILISCTKPREGENNPVSSVPYSFQSNQPVLYQELTIEEITTNDGSFTLTDIERATDEELPLVVTDFKKFYEFKTRNYGFRIQMCYLATMSQYRSQYTLKMGNLIVNFKLSWK